MHALGQEEETGISIVKHHASCKIEINHIHSPSLTKEIAVRGKALLIQMLPESFMQIAKFYLIVVVMCKRKYE